MLERALLLWDGESLNLDLPVLKSGQRDRYHQIHLTSGRTLRDITDEITERLCIEALQSCGGNKKKAARLPGISRDSSLSTHQTVWNP